MATQIKIVLFVYAAFGLMGLWLGNYGYTNWEPDSFNDESDLVAMMGFMLLVCGIAGTVLCTGILTGGEKRKPVVTAWMEHPLTLICPGLATTGTLMFYGYMAGPFAPYGGVVSPWLILPMAGSLTVFPLVLKLLELETSLENTSVEQSKDNA